MEAALLAWVGGFPEGGCPCEYVVCEAKGGFEVEVFQARMVEFQVQKGQGLVGSRDFALVARAVDGLLDDVGLDEALFPVFEIGDATAHGRGLVSGLCPQVVPDVEEGGFDETDHAGG